MEFHRMVGDVDYVLWVTGDLPPVRNVLPTAGLVLRDRDRW
jgi:hypothetical protein